MGRAGVPIRFWIPCRISDGSLPTLCSAFPVMGKGLIILRGNFSLYLSTWFAIFDRGVDLKLRARMEQEVDHQECVMNLSNMTIGDVYSFKFRDSLEKNGDFGVFWRLLSAELHRRNRCLAIYGDLLTVRLSPSLDTRLSFELAFQFRRFEVNQHLIAEVMPVLRKNGWSAS
ncbi:hypothetical protein F2Q69_00043198 [Brassica cretica]|uniref:Uncharacterized protein n=1 Tax=Brassica cretica TaxID=69181 RepID=A0A8S9NGW7_BRACR|nr:hypothetical protein F2Q69_00043198 [Brassica cretica]